MLEPRLKPWPYETLGFGYFFHLIDGTTKRFNDNTKMVVVEGPPGKESSAVLPLIYSTGTGTL
jgi:hypothetical protein